MEYMLVLQWPSASTVEDLDLLITLEDQITANIGDYGTIDGHDSGSGERDVFTEDPKSAFEQIKAIALATNPMKTLKVGYRLTGEDDLVPLYPDDLQHFSVI